MPRRSFLAPRNDVYGVYGTKDATFTAFAFFTLNASLRGSRKADVAISLECVSCQTSFCHNLFLGSFFATFFSKKVEKSLSRVSCQTSFCHNLFFRKLLCYFLLEESREKPLPRKLSNKFCHNLFFRKLLCYFLLEESRRIPASYLTNFSSISLKIFSVLSVGKTV